MKKLILLLLLPFFALSQVSTGQEQEFDTGIKNNSTQTVTSPTYIVTQGNDGTYGKVTPSNLLTQTTAGTFARVNFTGDVSVVNAVNYYATSTTSKGSVASVAQTVMPDDDQKLYFAQDYISILQPSLVIYPAGNYSGQFAVQVANNSAQQKFYIEVYKTNNLGVPIASGVSGASVGSLGVTLITTLESGLVSLTGSVLTNITLTGNLTGTLTVNANERIRYHIAAEKVGTAGGTISMQIFSGTNYNSYYDVPVPVTTDGVTNKSAVVGNSTTEALNTLNSTKANDANVIHTTGNESKSGILSMVDRIQFGTAKTTYGQAIGVSKTITTLDTHIFDDYSVLNSVSGDLGFGVFDASTEMTGSNSNNHFNAYQSRLLYSSSANMTNGMAGFYVFNSHTGSGILPFAYGFYAENLAGSGNVLDLYGLYIKPQTRGTNNNWDIYATGDNNTMGALNIGTTAHYNGVDRLKNSGSSYLAGNIKSDSDLFIRNGAAIYSYGAGSETGTNNKFSAFYNNGANSIFLSGGTGSFSGSISPWLFNTFNGSTVSTVLQIKTNGDAEFHGAVFTDQIRPYNTNNLKLLNGGANTLEVDGTTKINTLSGTGTRNVAADASGNLVISSVDSRPYKVYSFSITQSGTSAPTVSVSENTLGGTVIWTRTGIGVYRGTLTGAFPIGKSYSIGANTYNSGLPTNVTARRASNDYFEVVSLTPTGGQDGLLNDVFLEFRVYP